MFVGTSFDKLLNVAIVVPLVLAIEHVDDRFHGYSASSMHDVKYGIGTANRRKKALQLLRVVSRATQGSVAA